MNKSPIKIVTVALISGSICAQAQLHETFAENPVKRQRKAQQARERCRCELEEARKWAEAKGMSMRTVDDSGGVRELIAVRNGRPIFYATRNVNAAISIAADQVRSTAPFHVAGSNTTIGVWDGGSVLGTHQEFFPGQVSVRDGSAAASHSTAVGGVLAAEGVDLYVTLPDNTRRNLGRPAKGMAPSARLDSYNWQSDTAEMIERAAAAPGEPANLYLSNHSYGLLAGWFWDQPNRAFQWLGFETFGQYAGDSAAWDSVVYDAPYFLPFVAIGNDRNNNPSQTDNVIYPPISGFLIVNYNPSIHPQGNGEYKNGYDTVPPPGTGKNLITVGAVHDAVNTEGARSLGQAEIIDFSSWGPTDDGRIKPDIVANGHELFTCSLNPVFPSVNNYYITISGTSFSSPSACGSAALLVDYFSRRFPESAMRASTLKGLILHTADDLGRPGPDYSYGWGLMNTLAAAALIKDYADGNSLRMSEGLLHEGTNRSDSVTLYSTGAGALRITLCWTDPPSADIDSSHDNRSPKLVHNLRLQVTAPDGTRRFPYTLDYNRPEINAAINAENDVDNIEQVYIAAPEAGVYTVTVDYKGTLNSAGEQWYSLLINGVGDQDSDGIPDGWESQYFMNPTGAVANADTDGDGFNNLAEYIAGTDPTNAASFFTVDTFSTQGGQSVIEWDAQAGRIYHVDWTDDLVYQPFSNIWQGVSLPSEGSYTDAVERASRQNFYRMGVGFGTASPTNSPPDPIPPPPG